MLNRTTLDELIRHLSTLLRTDPDNAYAYALKFLDDVILEFHTDKGVVATKELGKLQNGKKTHWNKYHQLQEKLTALAKFQKIDPTSPKKLANAFRTVYLKYNGMPPPNPDLLEEELANDRATMDDITFRFSKLFAGGITLEICQRYQAYEDAAPREQQPSESVIGQIGNVLGYVQDGYLPQFIISTTNDVIPKLKKVLKARQEAHDKLLGDSLKETLSSLSSKSKNELEKEIESLKLLINSFKVASNEAIKLINMDKESNSNIKLDLIEVVDSAFKAFVADSLKAMDLEVSNDQDFYKQAYEQCDRIINVAPANPKYKHREKAQKLKQNILMFHQRNVVPPDFGIMNPALILAPGTSQNPQYQRLYEHLSTQLVNRRTLDPIKQEIIKISTNQGIIGKIVNIFYGRTESDSNSTDITSENAKALLNRLGKLQLNGVADFITVASTLNQAVFRFTKDVPDKRSTALRLKLDGSMIAAAPDSPLRAAAVAGIQSIRNHINRNADAVKVLIGAGQSNGLTMHDLYFELNISQNILVKEIIEKKYKAASSFPRSLLNVFGTPPLEEKRGKFLGNLMNQLVASKTEDDYIAFFVQANKLLLGCRDSLRWDGLFKETVQQAIRTVIHNHILVPGKLKLDFSTDQLQLISKFLTVQGMQNTDVFDPLMQMIERRKKLEANLPDETRIMKANEVHKNAEEQLARGNSQSDLDGNNAKVHHFKTTLLHKLESHMLADIVISTGRFSINNRDYGIIASKLSSVISLINVPGVQYVCDFAKQKAEEYDKKMQLQEASLVGTLAAKCGGYQMMFNEILSSAVSELTQMFEAQIMHMYSTDEAQRFAEFCFNRMDTAMKMTLEQCKARGWSELSTRDLLIASVFLVRKDLTSIPFRRDHYRTVDDTSWLSSWVPQSTFQGLVANVGIYNEEPVQSEEEQAAKAEAPRLKEKGRLKEGDQGADVSNPMKLKLRDEEQPQKTTSKVTIFLKDQSLQSQAGGPSKFEKYQGFVCTKLPTEILEDGLLGRGLYENNQGESPTLRGIELKDETKRKLIEDKRKLIEEKLSSSRAGKLSK